MTDHWLWRLMLDHPLATIILMTTVIFVTTSHLLRSPWNLRNMGSNLGYSCLSFRKRQKYWFWIKVLNGIGFLLSFPCGWSKELTHRLLYGPVRNTYIRCASHADAYIRAKNASNGQEPLNHPPHKEQDLHHFHLNNHSFLYKSGFRENPHFQYRQ